MSSLLSASAGTAIRLHPTHRHPLHKHVDYHSQTATTIARNDILSTAHNL